MYCSAYLQYDLFDTYLRGYSCKFYNAFKGLNTNLKASNLSNNACKLNT